MMEHPDEFKQFVAVTDGGGLRRNPKRKTAGSLQSRPDTMARPTEEQMAKAFEQRVKMMAQGGAYGDNLEIVAFSQAFNVDINVYSEEARVWYVLQTKNRADHQKYPTLYIVHHVSPTYLRPQHSLTPRTELGAFLLHSQHRWSSHGPADGPAGCHGSGGRTDSGRRAGPGA